MNSVVCDDSQILYTSTLNVRADVGRKHRPFANSVVTVKSNPVLGAHLAFAKNVDLLLDG